MPCETCGHASTHKNRCPDCDTLVAYYLERLESHAEELASIDERRGVLIGEVDDLISALRSSGVAWSEINAALGTTNVQVSWQRRRASRDGSEPVATV